MKKILIAMTVLSFAACNKQQEKLYEDTDPSIYFTVAGYSYSFIADMDSSSKVIFLPVKLSGMMKDYDRKFTVQAVGDSNTNAESGWYQLLEGTLPRNSVNGTVPVVLKRNERVDTSIVKLKLKLIPGNALDTMPSGNIQVTWTGKIIQPVNWARWLRWYFGTPFSTGWYKFIIDVTGRSSFPYEPILARTDPATWWMSAAEIQAYSLQVKEALQAYNAAHPDAPLRHNDGPYMGELVSMP